MLVANDVAAGRRPALRWRFAPLPFRPHVCIQQSWRDYDTNEKSACVPREHIGEDFSDFLFPRNTCCMRKGNFVFFLAVD